MTSPGGPPSPPAPGDCCGSGCTRCVWDIYEDALEAYNAKASKMMKSVIAFQVTKVEHILLNTFAYVSVKTLVPGTELAPPPTDSELHQHVRLKPSNIICGGEDFSSFRTFSVIDYQQGSGCFNMLMRLRRDGIVTGPLLVDPTRATYDVTWHPTTTTLPQQSPMLLQSNKHNIITFIAGGTGISPFLNVIRSWKRSKIGLVARITLWHVVSGTHEMNSSWCANPFWREYIAETTSPIPTLHVDFKEFRGRDMLRNYIIKTEEEEGSRTFGSVYICGPAGMAKDLSVLLMGREEKTKLCDSVTELEW
eukprot:PhF_6_TR11036/c0_g1_i1/m.17893/K00326/E1.6.2.2; cytochrome-b5 reductase